MKCKQCGREIPEAAIYCCWCGVKQLRERRKKDAIKVPKPRKLRSGAWNIELRAEGQSITEATAELCEAKARAIRAGFIEAKKAAPKMTVDAALEAYIKSRELLSPSTLRGYEAIRPRPENHGQGAECPGGLPEPAVPCQREPDRQAAYAVGPA